MNLKSCLVMLLGTVPLIAGPPLICHPIDIGSAKSLPWTGTSGWDGADASYDVPSRLTADTLALLAPGTPVPVRMETIRRASIYAARNARLAPEIAAKLRARAERSGRALDWFDAGYWIESARQASFIYRYDMLARSAKKTWQIRQGLDGLDGYPLVQKAIQLGGARGMDKALALIEEYRNADRRAASVVVTALHDSEHTLVQPVDKAMVRVDAP